MNKRTSLLLACAVFCLAAAARAEDVPILAKQLKSPEVEARRTAAKSLAEVGAEAKPALPALIAAVKDDKDLFVRRFSAQAIGEIGRGAKTAVPVLTKAMKEDNKEMAEAAVLALGKIGPDAIAVLTDALKAPAARGKAKDKDKKKKDNTPSEESFLRRKAAEALGSMGPDAKAAVPALTQALKDRDVRGEAATALGAIGPDAKAAVPALNELAKAKSKDKNFKKIVSDALQKIQA